MCVKIFFMKKITFLLSFLFIAFLYGNLFSQTIITFDDQSWSDEEIIGTTVTLSGFVFTATEIGSAINLKVDNGNSA